MRKSNIIGYIAITIFIIFAIVLGIQIFLKLTGNSPTDIQILYTSFGLIISYLLLMSFKLGTFVGEVREFMKITKNSFSRLKEDTDGIKKSK